MKKFVKILLWCVAVAAVLLTCAWFLPMPAGLWCKVPQSAGYVGAFAQNNDLDELSFIDLGGYTHPETVLYRDGYVYASVKGGALIRMREDGSELTELLNTGGCLLGFDFAANGDIIAVDCAFDSSGDPDAPLRSGALLLLRADGSPAEILADKSMGCELFYPNALAVSSSGIIYFTDSTRAFPPTKYENSSSAAAANEALMHTCTGRVLAYDPATAQVSTLADGLAFSNGVALSADERSLYVCETYANAIVRLDLSTNTLHPFLSDLPGFPDNLTRCGDRYYVGLNGERSPSLDAISARPLLRKLLYRYSLLRPSPESATGISHIFSFSDFPAAPAGSASVPPAYDPAAAAAYSPAVTRSLQSRANNYPRTTGAAESPTRLYLHSINDSAALAYIPLPVQ